ncbi:hypothetical protein BJV82DRAFT_675615 [Fennellomyces sp. T-0311]|nr:hypothetical protein BJV82DRAFT_675615 [Fennellomyces sp. T-0311]
MYSGAGNAGPPGLTKRMRKIAAFGEMSKAIKEATGVDWDAQMTKSRFESYKKQYTAARNLLNSSGFGREVTDEERKKSIHTIVDKMNALCYYYYKMDAIFGDRENINPSTVLHAGVPRSSTTHAATLAPASANASTTTVTVADTEAAPMSDQPASFVALEQPDIDEPQFESYELLSHSYEQPEDSYEQHEDSYEQYEEVTQENIEEVIDWYLERYPAPTPAPIPEESSAGDTEESSDGEEDEGDDEDNVPTGKNFTAVYAAYQVKRRKLDYAMEKDCIKLERQKLDVKKKLILEKRRASKVEHFIQLLKLRMAKDEAKEIIEDMYDSR